jgi:hypothetical protein
MSAAVLIHVLISLVGIVSGFVVLFGLIAGKRLDGWTALFLTTTVLTSLTGFFLPAHKILPSHIIAAISVVVMAISIYARYSRHLLGAWRTTYVVTATIALYFHVLVLVFQSFLKVPSLKALAPTQSEPPFAIAQGTVLVLFIVLGTFAVKKFRAESLPVIAGAAASR